MSVVKIFSGNPLAQGTNAAQFLGSGFLFSDRHLLTCWHVVQDVPADRIYLQGPPFGGGVGRIQGEVVRHPERDVAALQLLSPVKLIETLEIGQQFDSIPAGTELTLKGCTQSDLDIEESRSRVSVYDGAQHLYHTDKTIGRGMSGGPAIHNGKLVGITQAKDDAHTMIIPFSAFREFVRPLIRITPPTDDDSEQKRIDGIKKLKELVAEILQNEVTRRFILRKNRLSESLSAAELADRIFSVTHPNREADDYETPMCFLHRCTSPPAPNENERRGIGDHLGRIAALVAPVSFVVDDSSEIQAMIQKAASAARIPSNHSTVAVSLVATFLGLPVDFEHHEAIEHQSGFDYSGSPIDSWGKVHGASLTPIGSIEERDIVQVVATGLTPLIGAINSQLPHVRASLHILEQQKSYVCLWFNRALHSESSKALKTAFPDLFILTSDSKEESRINAVVMTQLEKLKKFIEGCQ